MSNDHVHPLFRSLLEPLMPAREVWTDAMDETVRQWSAGALTMTEAIALTGKSKNAICGRAGRLKLRHVDADVNNPRPVVDDRQLSSTGCQWPYGDPQGPGFRFCGEPRDEGCPYCKPHRRLAWVGVSVPRRPAKR